MSTPALSPPPDGNQNRGPQLLAIYWIQGGISILVVALRFYVRHVKRIIGAEDWAMLLALILYTTGSALLPVLIHYGIGRHIYYVPPEHLAQVLRWNWIIQPFGIAAQPFGKISVSIFLIKLMGPNDFWRKWFLYVNMVVFSILACLCVIFTYAQCNPSRALWEMVPGAKCWKTEVQVNFSIFTTAYGAMFDYSLSLLPITMFWNLKIDVKRKVGLYILLGVSVFSGIGSTVKAIQLHELGVRTDVTWDTYTLYAWASTELFINILCGSIPTLKPLYDKWAHGRALSSHSKNSSNQLKDSTGSPKQTADSKNDASLSTDNNQYGVNFEESITVTHSFDVRSAKNFAPKEMI